MITRSNLADQLREYQIRSKYDWASVSFFSSTASVNSSRVDVVLLVIWELIILAFLVFSAVSLYFRYMRLAFCLICIAILLFVCLKITKQVKLARKRKRRMLLPLSMKILIDVVSESTLEFKGLNTEESDRQATLINCVRNCVHRGVKRKSFLKPVQEAVRKC